MKSSQGSFERTGRSAQDEVILLKVPWVGKCYIGSRGMDLRRARHKAMGVDLILLLSRFDVGKSPRSLGEHQAPVDASLGAEKCPDD